MRRKTLGDLLSARQAPPLTLLLPGCPPARHTTLADDAEARLEAVEDQLLPHGAAVTLGHAPLRVVVGTQERVTGGPGTAGARVSKR